jgi:hypothetical protein
VAFPPIVLGGIPTEATQLEGLDGVLGRALRKLNADGRGTELAGIVVGGDGHRL